MCELIKSAMSILILCKISIDALLQSLHSFVLSHVLLKCRNIKSVSTNQRTLKTGCIVTNLISDVLHDIRVQIF